MAKLLRSLKTHKATGRDSVPSHLLKITAEESAGALQLIFQAPICQGVVPNDWKKAHVVPIFNKGDEALTTDQSPSPITSVCSKIMEHVIRSCINRKLIYDFPSFEYHVQVLWDDVVSSYQRPCKSIDESSQSDAILFDFFKTFGKVPHSRLLLKLQTSSAVSHMCLITGRSGLQHVTCHWSTRHCPWPSSVNDLPSRVCSTLWMFADDCWFYIALSTLCKTPTCCSLTVTDYKNEKVTGWWRWTNSGCSFNTVVRPVVEPVVQPVWQPVVSCKRGFSVKPSPSPRQETHQQMIVNVNFFPRHCTRRGQRLRPLNRLPILLSFYANAKHIRPSNRVISPLLNSPSLKWTRPSKPPADRINMVIDYQK